MLILNTLGCIFRIALMSSACLIIASCSSAERTTDKKIEVTNKVISLEEFSAVIRAKKVAQVKDLLHLSIKSKAECLKHNGEWGPQGRARKPGCIIRTEDSGKICSSSSQCQSYCVVSRENPRIFDLSVGEKVQGQCDSTNVKFGCRFYVENGAYFRSVCRS